MVTSSTTIGVLAIPTGYLCREKFKFRSPDVYYLYYACQVESNGNIGDRNGWNATYSYGRSSPVLEVSIGVWCVDNFGANDNDDVWDVDYSYGHNKLSDH